eukprot:923908_1
MDETESDAKTADDQDGDTSQQSILRMLAKHDIFFKSPSSVPAYYDMLTDPHHKCLDDAAFVGLLIEYGLIKGITHHMQQNKDRREEVIPSVKFITHLLQKQPQFTKQIVDSCAPNTVHLIDIHSADSDALHPLYELIHTSIGNDPDVVSLFKQNESEMVLQKILKSDDKPIAMDEDTNKLLSMLKGQDEVMSELNSIKTIALQLIDNPNDVDLIETLRQQLQSTMPHINSASLIKPVHQAFVHLYKTKQGAELAVESGAIQLALQSLKSMGDNPHVNDCCVNAVKIIGTLATQCPVRSANVLLSDEDGLRIIMNALNKLHSDPTICAGLIETIDILCGLTSEVMQGFIDAGAVEAVVNVFNVFHSGGSLLELLLLIACMELVCKLARSDDSVADSIRQNGMIKSIGCIALAMDSHAESSQLIDVGRRTLATLMRENDLHEAMDIIARSQSEPSSVDRNMLQYAISIVGNIELSDENIKYIVSHNAIPLFIAVISGEAVDVILLASTLRALSRFLTTPDTIAIWESENGMKRFEDVVHNSSHSELVMYAMCGAINNILSTKHGSDIIKQNSELMSLITNKVFKSHSYYTMWIPKYYAMLADPQNHILDDTEFMASLIAAGLIDGINNHLERNKANPQQAVTSMAFIMDSVSNQPELSTKALAKDRKCVQNTINVMQLHDNDRFTLESAYNALYALIQNQSNILNSFSDEDHAVIATSEKIFAEAAMKEEVDDATNNKVHQFLVSQLSIFFESPSNVPAYYNLLMDSQHAFLDDTNCVRLLIAHGLMKGIRYYLQQHQERREDVIASVEFIIHLLQRQPQFTKKITNRCVRDIVKLIEIHATDSNVLHSLYEAVRTSIRNDADVITSFKRKGLKPILDKILRVNDKQINEETNGLLSLFKEHNVELKDVSVADNGFIKPVDGARDSMCKSVDRTKALIESKVDDDEISTALSQQLLMSLLTTKKVLESSFVPQYYEMLMNPQREFLRDTLFVNSLMRNGLIDGINNHLEQHKNRRACEDVLSSMAFITHLQSQQPHVTKDIMFVCAPNIVALIEMYSTDPNVLHSLYEAIHTTIRNDPRGISLLNDHGLEAVLHKILESEDKQINDETNNLLSILKEEDQIMNELESIKEIALEFMDKANQSKLKKQLQSVMSHVNSASLIKPMHQSFCNLYKTKQCARLAVNSGAIQFALSYLCDTSQANECCVFAAKIITELATQCPAKSAKILLSDDNGTGSGLSIIVDVLSKHHSDPAISAALIEMINKCCTNRDKLIRGFIDANGVQCLLKAFQKHAMHNDGGLAIHAIESLLKCTRFDDVFVDSTLLITMRTIAYAMDTNPQSSELKKLGSDALKVLVDEKHLPAVMDIIVESQHKLDSFDLQLVVSLIGNMELSEDNIEYIVSEKGGIPLFLCIISAHLRDETHIIDSIGLFSTVHALSRLLITPHAIAIWESKDGIKIFETIINNASHSELVMIAVCDAIESVLCTLGGADIIKQKSDLLLLITKNVFKSNSDYTKCIAKYYDILINPKHEMLDKIGFVNALVESGLMEGINNHLQHNMKKTDEVIASINFMAILVSKQPKCTSDIIKNCGQSVVHAVDSRRNNDA